MTPISNGSANIDGMLDADIQDPRERSRAKAKARFKALIEEAGGALTPDQVTARLQISSERLAEMTEAREILVLRVSDTNLRDCYPVFQFDENGVIDGVREVLQILQDETGLPSCSFLLMQDVDLDGLSRLKALSRPDLRPYVLRAAKQRGHQGPL